MVFFILRLSDVAICRFVTIRLVSFRFAFRTAVLRHLLPYHFRAEWASMSEAEREIRQRFNAVVAIIVVPVVIRPSVGPFCSSALVVDTQCLILLFKRRSKHGGIGSACVPCILPRSAHSLLCVLVRMSSQAYLFCLGLVGRSFDIIISA